MNRCVLIVVCAAALSCLLPAQTATYADYGQGCPAASAAKVIPDRWDSLQSAWMPSLPKMGEVFGLSVPFAPGDVAGFLILGGSNTAWMGLPLPLTVFWRQRIYPVTMLPEFGPCLLAAPQIVLPAPVPLPGGKDRRWALQFPVPRDPALLGVALYAQWAVFYQNWLYPQPPKPMFLTEEGLRWSSGGVGVIGSL